MRNPNFIFDNMIRDRSNSKAITVCKRIANNPDKSHGFVWIFGPSGCGKTHLLGAIYHRLSAQRADVLYTTSEEMVAAFVNHFIGYTCKLYDDIVNTKFLMIDDIEFFYGKTVMYSEFKKLISEKCALGHTIIVASNRITTSMAELSRRIKEHTPIATVVKISPPTIELKEKYFQSYTNNYFFGITKNARSFLIENTESISQLLGSLNAARLCYRTKGHNVNVYWASKYIDAIKR